MDGEKAPNVPSEMPPFAGELLAAEFNYIAQSAFQANEDRARVSQFFFVTFGTFIAALVSSQISEIEPAHLFTAFAIAFLTLALLGALTLLHLARLRSAWRECAAAMNQIKAGLVHTAPELASYFRWTGDTLPPLFKLNSVAFLLALMVALLTGLAAGTAVAMSGLAGHPDTVAWFPSIASGVAGTLVSLYCFYYLPLRPPA